MFFRGKALRGPVGIRFGRTQVSNMIPDQNTVMETLDLIPEKEGGNRSPLPPIQAFTIGAAGLRSQNNRDLQPNPDFHDAREYSKRDGGRPTPSEPLFWGRGARVLCAVYAHHGESQLHGPGFVVPC